MTFLFKINIVAPLINISLRILRHTICTMFKFVVIFFQDNSNSFWARNRCLINIGSRGKISRSSTAKRRGGGGPVGRFRADSARFDSDSPFKCSIDANAVLSSHLHFSIFFCLFLYF